MFWPVAGVFCQLRVKRYTAHLRQVATLYERIITMFLCGKHRISALGQEAADCASAVFTGLRERVNQPQRRLGAYPEG